MDASPPPDEPLLQRLRDLDQSAWAALFDEHHDKLWRYLFAKTGDRTLADDVASQTFAEALESIHRFRHRGKPLLAWLYGIARNQLSKRLRTARRETSGAVPEASSNPLDAALDAVVLGDALDSLTRDQADAIVLRYYAGYSTREIAGAMSKSESAVYSLQIRALASLRRQLEGGR